MRRDYRVALLTGIAFTAFAAAEAVHGERVPRAFAAGMTIAALDVNFGDCFVEYGGVTAEDAVAVSPSCCLEARLIWSAFTVINGATLIFTAIVVVIRTPVYLLSLIGSGVDMRGRLLIAWFGPRGLSALLLILLPVLPPAGSEELSRSAHCGAGLVVLHGGSPMLLARARQKRR